MSIDEIKASHRRTMEKRVKKFGCSRTPLESVRRRLERRASAAERIERREHYVKTRFAPEHRKRWCEKEVELLFDPNVTDSQIAQQLGRSMGAIALARIRYARYAPPNYVSKASKKKYSLAEVS